MRLRVASFLLLVVLMVSARISNATTVILTSIPDLFSSSDIIFEGDLAHIEVFYDKKSKSNVTNYRFNLKKIYKGKEKNDTILITVPGGILGSHETIVEGMPHFRKSDVGKTFIVALEKISLQGDTYYLPYGLTQGIFWFSEDHLQVHRHITGHAIYSYPICMGGEGENQFDIHEFYTWLEKTTVSEVE